METVRRLCEEAERNFDPSRSMMENLVGVEFRPRAAVALWNFVKDMDEGGFRLWFERGHGDSGRRTLGPYLARMNCKVTQRVIQMIKLVFARREMVEMIAEPVDYADLDAEWKTLREGFCLAAERFLNKCPGCDAKTIDGPHRFRCHFAGAGQISLPVMRIGDEFVADNTNPLVKEALEALKRTD